MAKRSKRSEESILNPVEEIKPKKFNFHNKCAYSVQTVSDSYKIIEEFCKRVLPRLNTEEIRYAGSALFKRCCDIRDGKGEDIINVLNRAIQEFIGLLNCFSTMQFEQPSPLTKDTVDWLVDQTMDSVCKDHVKPDSLKNPIFYNLIRKVSGGVSASETFLAFKTMVPLLEMKDVAYSIIRLAIKCNQGNMFRDAGENSVFRKPRLTQLSVLRTGRYRRNLDICGLHRNRLIHLSQFAGIKPLLPVGLV